MEEGRLREALKRIKSQKLIWKQIPNPSPFSFPIITDRMRENLSSEKFEDRIKKMVGRIPMKNIKKIIHDQTLTFDFRKVVFWKETSSLVLSDVHVGKINSF